MARKNEYLDPLIDKGAIFVKGDKDGAMEIMVRFEKLGWKDISSEDVADVMTYESPDGKWKINMRDISSSSDDLLEKGYKVETTLDVIGIKNGKKLKEEIKFILLK